MKTIAYLLLFFLFSSCESVPSRKQQMLEEIYLHHQEMKQIEKSIDLGLPKMEEDFYRSILKDLEEQKSKNTIKL